ncbi:hypothetical protein N8784_05270 [Candidatus Pelagibacter sp.]|nr:hypothetical protein [Candidatus Pelagibacter sp.]
MDKDLAYIIIGLLIIIIILLFKLSSQTYQSYMLINNQSVHGSDILYAQIDELKDEVKEVKSDVEDIKFKD